MVAAYRAGQLIGITPTTRTVPRHLRRVIERRDQGCAHPLCTQTRWLHIHHIVYWHHRGMTVPSNLVCLCPTHHRELHEGLLPIDGQPRGRHAPLPRPPRETDRTTRHGARRRPLRPRRADRPSRPPDGERLVPLWFSWN